MQNRPMMPSMANDDIRQRPDTDGRFVGDSLPLPCRTGQALEEAQMRSSQKLKFVNQIVESVSVKAGTADVRILVEARQWRPVLAGKTKGAVAEDALGVGHVADNLLHA